MNATPILRLGTRNSPLAMAQAVEARERLCAAHGWAQDAVELVPVVASGDKIQDRPLADIGGKALWTRELDAWLGAGRIQASVHSMKDVETIRPELLHIGAILEREDKRDVLIGAPSIASIPTGARVGTSAPRRAAQMLHARPDLEVVTFRGNVATRLAKLEAGEADVTLLAAAGLNRLGKREIGAPLDMEQWLPAPAQGAIGLECRADDSATRALLAAIDHPPSRTEVMAERALLAGLSGTCHSPIAVLATYDGGGIDIRVALYSGDGAERLADAARFAPGDAAALEEWAGALLGRASPAIRTNFGGQA